MALVGTFFAPPIWILPSLHLRTLAQTRNTYMPFRSNLPNCAPSGKTDGFIAFAWGVPCAFLRRPALNSAPLHTDARGTMRWIGGALFLVITGLLPLGIGGCKKDTASDDTIKVGILHSLSGTMAISESSLKDAELMAIEEINAAGGVQVGDKKMKIEPIVVDPESKFTSEFPAKAEKLLLKDKVAAVFGCWTSTSRVNVLPKFEENNGLLFYPVQYEGNECSWNCIYSGAAPNQQILPAIEWLMTPEAPKALGIKKDKFTKFYL